MAQSMNQSIKKLFISLGLHTVFLFMGSILTKPSLTPWYESLNKPSWTPPNAAFPIVWPILFLMMAISFWMIWKEFEFKKNQNAYVFYGLQLALNVMWSYSFFFMQNPLYGMINIALLITFVLLTIQTFMKLKPTAAYLLFPYLFWLFFAAFLNRSIWLLNS